MRVAWVSKFAYPVGMLLDRISPHFLFYWTTLFFFFASCREFSMFQRKNQHLVTFLISHLREQCVFSLSGPSQSTTSILSSFSISHLIREQCVFSLSKSPQSSTSILSSSPISHLREQCLFSLSKSPEAPQTSCQVPLSLILESSVFFLCLGPPKSTTTTTTTTTKVSVLSLSRHPWHHHHC